MSFFVEIPLIYGLSIFTFYEIVVSMEEWKEKRLDFADKYGLDIEY